MDKRKQRLGTAGITLVILLLVGGSLYAFFMTRKETVTEQEETSQGKGQFAGKEGMITASGTTAIGMDAITFEIDFLEEASLYVEEVYLSSGDEVEAGTKLLKLTDDSVEAAREELQNTAKEAELSYRSGVITTNQSKIQAKYTYETALLESQQAEQIYTDTITELQENVDQAKSAYDDAQEAYHELYQAVENNTLRADYEVDEKKAAYEEAHELYVTKVAYWEVTEEELKSSTDSTGSSATTNTQSTTTPATGSMQKGIDKEAAAAAADRKWIIKTVQLLKEEDEETKEAYEQAQSDYEDALESAELELKTLLNKLETAREDYEDATIAFEKASASAKTIYQLATATQGTAEKDYETTLTSLDEALEKLKDAKEEADENLALFEELVGDCYFYTTEAGTLLMVRATKGQALVGDDILFAYSNPAEISVSVSVSQDDIAELAVGDTATIMITDVGSYTGTITTINPVAASDSKTTVSYTVQLAIEGDVSAIEANLSATVIFGDVEMPQNVGKHGDMSENKEMPEGMEMPENMQAPEGMDRPADVEDGQQRQKGAEHE